MQVFSTNLTDDVAVIVLEEPIETTALRIIMPHGLTSVDSRACIRLEAYGCPVKEEGTISHNMQPS